MDILKAIDAGVKKIEDGQPYQEWFETVQADSWFLTTSGPNSLTQGKAGSIYGEFGFFCFFDSQEI